jgi:hypothetical protein
VEKARVQLRKAGALSWRKKEKKVLVAEDLTATRAAPLAAKSFSMHN